LRTRSILSPFLLDQDAHVETFLSRSRILDYLPNIGDVDSVPDFELEDTNTLIQGHTK
jgi:hypothetical protein